MVARKKQEDGNILNVDANMQGNFIFKDPVDLRINGSFEGVMETKGSLTVGKSADVKASITGEDIIISGKVKGDILAKSKLVLRSGSELEGNVSTPKLVIEDGAVFDGRCSMSNDELNLLELSEYLEVTKDKIGEWIKDKTLPAFKKDGQWNFRRKDVDLWLASTPLKEESTESSE